MLSFGFLCFLLVFHVASVSLSAQVSRNLDMLDHWHVDTLVGAQGIFFNEVWHFERAERDYAILGSTEGTHFFEISDQDSLRFIGFIQGTFASAQVHNRDFRDFGDYVYAVADQGFSSALQIINIAQLPDLVFLEKTDSTNWNRAHTLCIDANSALLYACSFRPPIANPTLMYSPLKVFSLADPLNPALVFSGLDNVYEVHYAYVRGDTVFLNCGFDGLRIYNFSNPSSPILLGSLNVYNDQGYNHSGWLSEDGKTYFFTDESVGKRIKMVDVSDLSNPKIIRSFGTENFEIAIAHHIVPVGDLLFVSYYTEGLRIFDTRFPVREIAFYDTHPLQSNFDMNGAWGVSPYKKGKRILVSDRTYGLFLFDFDHELFSKYPPTDFFVAFPNPVAQNTSFRIFMKEVNLDEFQIRVTDLSGRIVYKNKFVSQSYAEVSAVFATGLYTITIGFYDYLDNWQEYYGKIVVQ